VIPNAQECINAVGRLYLGVTAPTIGMRMPSITLRHFAIIREAVGAETEKRTYPDGTTAADVLADYAARYPRIAGLLRSSPLMVNAAYADAHTPLEEGDELAFIPPVAGGVPSPLFVVTEEPLDVNAVAALVAAPDAGAIITFIGTVRDHARGRAVRWLEYEAYAAGCLPIFARIADEMRAKWPVGLVAIHHRVGHLEVGAASVVIAVASAHRHEGFAACEYAIDRLKQLAPIWKKEAYADGEVWIGAEAAYQSLPDRRR
jgi:molybdopterin synthase catalytic subunit/molybdopterin converting factor small subunit